MDLAGPDRQVDAVVGDDTRESLGDAAHLQGRRRRPGGHIRIDRDAACGDVGGGGRRIGVAAVSGPPLATDGLPGRRSAGSAGDGCGGTSATSASSRSDGRHRINESGEVPKALAARFAYGMVSGAVTGPASCRRRDAGLDRSVGEAGEGRVEQRLGLSRDRAS